jgi:hypothetical protein
MALLTVVFYVIPQIQISAELITEVTSRLLHFLVGTAMSTTTTITVCNMLSSMTCATPALLIMFTP